MLSFSASGRLGRVDRPKGDCAIIRLSIACDRLIDGPSGKWTKTEWLSLVSFDRAWNERLFAELAVGDFIECAGRIEPRKRPIGEINVTDHSFVLERFKLLSRSKGRSQETAA